MKDQRFKAGEVRAWLDQGPALLMAQCRVEARAIAIGEKIKEGTQNIEQGWVIRLLMTGEILTVHEDTLHNGEIPMMDEQRP